MPYVDGFLLSVPKRKLAVYRMVMKDPRMLKTMKEPMPFDVKRMSMGGFKVIVDLT